MAIELKEPNTELAKTRRSLHMPMRCWTKDKCLLQSRLFKSKLKVLKIKTIHL
jgi:hypothetical protein